MEGFSAPDTETAATGDSSRCFVESRGYGKPVPYCPGMQPPVFATIHPYLLKTYVLAT